MANWSNVRLIVFGPEPAVRGFRTQAHPYLVEARLPQARAFKAPRWPIDPEPLFRDDMVRGEGRDLSEEPVEHLVGGMLRARYLFQARSDDGVEHFRAVSLRFPALRFLVVWGDPNADSVGSAYIRNGRAGVYEVGTRRRTAFYDRARRRWGRPVDDDADDDYVWEAYSDMMDAAERRWRHYMPARKRRRATRSSRGPSA